MNLILLKKVLFFLKDIYIKDLEYTALDFFVELIFLCSFRLIKQKYSYYFCRAEVIKFKIRVEKVVGI